MVNLLDVISFVEKKAHKNGRMYDYFLREIINFVKAEYVHMVSCTINRKPQHQLRLLSGSAGKFLKIYI